MSEFQIRLAQPADVPELAALAGRTFVAAYGASLPPADLADFLATRYTAAAMGGDLERPGAWALLAETKGAAVGFAQLETTLPPPETGDPNGVRLLRFYLEQAWIGRGVARPLMDRCKLEARARGHTSLWLSVWQQAPRPIAFYRREGFREVGVMDFTIGGEIQKDWLMACPL